MIAETMTPKERIDAAIRLEKVDRTPVVAGLTRPFACKYQGMTVADAHQDVDRAIQAVIDTFDGLSGCDAIYNTNVPPPRIPTLWAIHRLMPGKELPDDIDIQDIEEEVMKEDEYDRILDIGWREFWLELVKRVHKGMSWDALNELNAARSSHIEKEDLAFKQKGIHRFVDGATGDPIVMLAIWRSHVPFIMDLHRRPDKVRAAIEVMTKVFIDWFLDSIRRVEISRIMIAAGRYTIPYVAPWIFEELVWPYLKRVGEMAIDEGITPIFHLDQDWTDNLSYFKELPKGKCVVHFDGTTDIFKAKEILGGHICLMGDVSPAMLSTSSTQEVELYCRKLIDVVGENNGFILCNGCLMPATAKFENVKTMVDVAKNYMP